MKVQNNPKKPLIYYGLVVICIIMILNTFILPAVKQAQIIQVDYGTFLKQVDSGKVKSVEIQDDQIGFTTVD